MEAFRVGLGQPVRERPDHDRVVVVEIGGEAVGQLLAAVDRYREGSDMVGQPGVGFSGSGSDASFTNSVSNNWQLNHSFSNIRFGCLICYGIQQDATATFQFGTSFYTISTHDDALI